MIARESRKPRLDNREAIELTGLALLLPGLCSDFSDRFEALAMGATLARGELSPGSEARESLEELSSVARSGQDLALRTLQLFAEDRWVVEPCDLSVVIAQTKKLFDAVLPASLDIRFHPGLNLPEVHADGSRVTQLLTHLVLAAAYAMPDGGALQVSSGLLECDEDRPRGDFLGGDHMRLGNYVYLEVSDQSAPPEGWPHEAGDDIRAICLQSALQLTRRYFGGLRVASRRGLVSHTSGTVVTAVLPVVPDIDEEAISPLAQGWHAGGLILVVDADERARTAVVGSLERLGFEILTTDSATRAQHLFTNNSDDIVLLLADLDAAADQDAALIRKVREMAPDVPILLSHHGPPPADPSPAEHFAPHDVALVHKPFRRPALRKKIRRLLDQGDEK